MKCAFWVSVCVCVKYPEFLLWIISGVFSQQKRFLGGSIIGGLSQWSRIWSLTLGVPSEPSGYYIPILVGAHIPTYWVLIPWSYRYKCNPTALPSRVDSSISPILYPVLLPVYSFYIPMISIFDPNYTPCLYPLCWVKGFWFLARSRSALPRLLWLWSSTV